MRKITVSARATKQLGQALGKRIKPGQILALSGTLGSGKTTFVQGFARGLGIRHKIKSPTFVTFYFYPIPKTDLTLYHFDLYRLKTQAELREIGFREIIKNKNSVTVIEWPEKAKRILPAKTKWIYFNHEGKHSGIRIIRGA